MGNMKHIDIIRKNYISKDKIKAEIGELEDVLDLVKTSKDRVAKIQAEILEKIINSLQKLLEEE